MTSAVTWARDGRTLTIRVPFSMRMRGGRKLVITPDGRPWSRSRALVDSSLIKALARAHRWKSLLETGEYASATELARSEKINMSYLSRVLRLTLLAPDIIEAVLDGRPSGTLQLAAVLKPFPIEWEAQRKFFVVGAERGALGRAAGGR
jgi:hypothetical protein